MKISRRLGVCSVIGVLLGSITAACLWWTTAPSELAPSVVEIVAPVIEAQDTAVTDIDALAQKAMATILEAPPERTLEDRPVLALSDWLAWQVHLLADVEEASKKPALIASFKRLIGNEALAEPEEELIEYAFYKWGQVDPEAAKAMEAELLELPAQYWFPFNGLYAGWAEHAPFDACDSLLERLQWSYCTEGKQYGISKVFQACFEKDHKTLLGRMASEPERLQKWLAAPLSSWQKKDAPAFLVWLRANPSHPVLNDRNLRRSLGKTGRGEELLSIDAIITLLEKGES